MDKNYIIKKIKELVPWYQAIDFNGILTQTYSKPNESAKSGEVLWNKIKTFLPETLEGKRVLDLGCNAGYYCIKSFLLNFKMLILNIWFKIEILNAVTSMAPFGCIST